MTHFMGETLGETDLRIRRNVIGMTETVNLETDLIKTDQEVWEEIDREVSAETDLHLDTSHRKRETDQDPILKRIIGRDIDMTRKADNTNLHQSTHSIALKSLRISTLISTSTYLKQKLSTWGS